MARSTLAFVGLLLLGSFAASAQEDVHEDVVVERVVVDAHVLDSSGEAVLGLTPADFRVTVDGAPAIVESVEWIDATRPHAEGLSPEVACEQGGEAAPAGRLLVFFFQTDFARMRVIGHVRMIEHAIALVESLEPQDRVAVVSHDSHLKLRQDFTGDRAALRRAIERSILIDFPDPVADGEPSLFAAFGRDDARDATSPEKALALVARGLKNLPGFKSLLMFGWGVGRLSRDGVSLDETYGDARSQLAEARTALYALDISDSDYHSLEAGLRRASFDTGGIYVKTNRFPAVAVRLMKNALAGHYVLVVQRSAGDAGLHEIDVRVPNRRGIRVHARRTFADQA